jgi:hypothetical protein
MQNNNNHHPGSADDNLTDLTGGLNYYILKQNAKLALNYIHHYQAWRHVLNLAGTGRQTGIRNDELLFETQLAF